MFNKIAIIHFGNEEQVLFAAPAIIGLKKQNPNSHITLFANNKAKNILTGWEVLDTVFPVDADHLIAFSKENSGKSISEILNDQVISRSEKFDLVINLCGDPIATILSTHLNCSERIGAFYNNESETQVNGAWSQYQSAVIGRTILNPFHLADVYKYIAHAHGEESGIEISPYAADAQKAAQTTSSAQGLKIGLILSHQWPIASSIAYAEEILESFPKANLYLLPASPNDANRENISRKFLESISGTNRERIVDLLPTNSMTALHALTNEMHLVAGPLSLCTHLAAASGTFTISLAFLDQALYEAGPYGHGHVIIADENQDASELSIPWNLAAGLTKFSVSTNGTKLPSREQFIAYCDSITHEVSPQFKILQATRVSFHQQDGTERVDMIYEPILTHGATLQECLLSFYRLIWQFDLNASEDTIDDVLISRTATVNGLINLVDALEKLHKISNFGSTYSRYVSDDLRKNDLALARQDSEKLQEIDNMISKMAAEIPAVAPLCNFYTVSQFQNRDSDPVKISDMARLAYERLQIQISIVLDLVQDLVTRTREVTKARRQPEADAP